MRFPLLLASILLMTLTGCDTTKDITKKPAGLTDFIVGESYQLKLPVLLSSLSDSLLPLVGVTVGDARQKLPSQTEALIEPGVILRVRRVVTRNNPMVGHLTDVYAEVVSGPLRGRTVNVRTISDDNWTTGQTKRDPKFLQPVTQP